MNDSRKPRILAIDTSGSFCSVALGKEGGRIFHRTTEGAGDHFERLTSLVAGVCADADCSIGDLTEVRIGLGPGSFTGLRIGMSFAKGLVVATRAALRGVSSFVGAAHAFLPRADGVSEVAVVADARREEIFLQRFALADGEVRALGEAVIAPTGEIQAWALGAGRRVITPSRGFTIASVDMEEEPGISQGILRVECPDEAFSMERVALLEPDYLRAVSAKSIEERLRG